MKWFKVETNDILFGGYENWQIVAIVKYKALAAQLEHEPDSRQLEKFLTKKEQNFIRNLSEFYQSSVEKTINSCKKRREIDLKRKSKDKELSKNSSAESTTIPYKEKMREEYNPHIPEGMLPPKGDTNTPEEIKNPEKQKKFIPPTVKEVSAYCLERDNAVNAGKFVDFYASKGWMVGKNKMKDWRAAVRTWEKDTPKQEQHTIGDWL